MIKQPIYFDYASTTPIDNVVVEKMLKIMQDVYGNPNSQHIIGREAVGYVDEARDCVAKIINCKANEVYFTSGGTESDNFALKGFAFANREKGKHIIISSIEHPAMIESAKFLEREGFSVDYAKVNGNGIIDIDNLKSLIRDDTILIGVMMANNEVGSIQPIKEIAKIAHDKGIVCFTDAVQTAGVLNIDVKELGVDMMSISSHKIYGPKGVGALYVKNGIKVDSLISGGHQERSKRGGTTNVAGIVGFSEALLIADKDREKNSEYVTSLRDRFIAEIESKIPFAKLNGDRINRLPANADFAFMGINGEDMLYNLDLSGICASMGSACSSGTVNPSHVLMAMGKDENVAKSSIRFTFGKHNTMEEVEFAIGEIVKIVEKLNKTSQLFHIKSVKKER